MVRNDSRRSLPREKHRFARQEAWDLVSRTVERSVVRVVVR